MSIINEKDNTIKIHACRICRDAESVNMVLLEEQNGWLKLFESCFGFSLTTQDEPRLLCKICAEKVQSYVEFKEKCQKSHNLWKSVIFDVKCYVVKHQIVENTTTTIEITNDLTSSTQIKDESSDPFFETDHFSNDLDIEMEEFSPADVKTETQENVTETRHGGHSNKKNKENSPVRNKVDSKQMNPKIAYINGSKKNKKTTHVYTCGKCKITYERKSWYLRHIKACRTKKKRKAIYNHDYAYDLGRKYDDMSQDIVKVKHEPQNNIEIMENENSLLSCGLCSLNFTDTKHVFEHLNDHWSNNNLACKLCAFVGVDMAAIISHRFSHLPRNKLRFVCHICQKSHVSLLALHFHYRREHLKKAGGYCSRCNKEYNKLRLWKKHELTHLDPNYVCDICGKGFFYKCDIIAHVIHHMQLDNSICDICGIILATQRYLKTHKAAVHNQSEPVKCTHCNRMFKSPASLKDHLKKLAKEKNMECEVCHNTFRSQKLLRIHMVSHSDERPHRCDLCGCAYKHKCHLKLHLQKHNGVVPQCPICMKTFSEVKSLKRHSSVHTGIRRYGCSVSKCDKTFHTKKQRLAHLQLRHKNEISVKSEELQEEMV